MITKENRKLTHLTTKSQFHNTKYARYQKTLSRIDEHLRKLMCDHVTYLWLAFSIRLRLVIFDHGQYSYGWHFRAATRC